MTRARHGGHAQRLAAAALVAAVIAPGCSSARDEDQTQATPTDDTGDEGPPHVIDPAPQLDATLSPYTGWSRAHYELAFARVVAGWYHSLSPGGARTTLAGGEELPAALEGAARVMPIIGAWLADPDNPRLISWQGEVLDLVAILRAGLVHGTDPAHPDYWGVIYEGWDQSSVEAASICEAILLAGDRLWLELSPAEQAAVFTWLAPSTSGFPNNWSLFVGIRNVTRKLHGQDYDPQLTATQMTALDGSYLGDGWYTDGEGLQVDFYNGFVIHHLLALWALHDPDMDAERSEQIRARLAAHLVDLPYFYARDGSRVPFGRSLAYRDAHLS
ncbi:MAG: DUF2264 domain-containing protein, partial [Myxococcales bacterium]|nr:DUF2264 domain-containing protein [Myxococcales bacterium]